MHPTLALTYNERSELPNLTPLATYLLRLVHVKRTNLCVSQILYTDFHINTQSPAPQSHPYPMAADTLSRCLGVRRCNDHKRAAQNRRGCRRPHLRAQDARRHN